MAYGHTAYNKRYTNLSVVYRTKSAYYAPYTHVKRIKYHTTIYAPTRLQKYMPNTGA